MHSTANRCRWKCSPDGRCYFFDHFLTLEQMAAWMCAPDGSLNVVRFQSDFDRYGRLDFNEREGASAKHQAKLSAFLFYSMFFPRILCIGKKWNVTTSTAWRWRTQMNKISKHMKKSHAPFCFYRSSRIRAYRTSPTVHVHSRQSLEALRALVRVSISHVLASPIRLFSMLPFAIH